MSASLYRISYYYCTCMLLFTQVIGTVACTHPHYDSGRRPCFGLKYLNLLVNWWNGFFGRILNIATGDVPIGQLITTTTACYILLDQVSVTSHVIEFPKYLGQIKCEQCKWVCTAAFRNSQRILIYSLSYTIGLEVSSAQLELTNERVSPVSGTTSM